MDAPVTAPRTHDEVVIEGLVPIVATPFDRRGNIDEEGLAREIDYLINAGVDALAMFGVAGEFYAVTDMERIRVVRFVVDHVRGRVPVIAGTGHTGSEAAAALSAEAEAAGAAMVMVIMPFFVKPDEEGVRRHLEAIDGTVSIPIMVQDQPHTTGVNLPVPLIARLGQDYRQVRYAKIETPAAVGKISALVRAVGTTMTVLGGNAGNYLLEELRAGSRGTMPAAVIPQVYRTVWDLASVGDWATAQAVFDRYFPIIRLTNVPGIGPGLVKSLLAWAEIIDHSGVRGPTPEPDPVSVRALREAVDRLGILEIMSGTEPVHV
jgi:4-hydroxy-tetrahydrodipicolinate synthase